MKVFALHKIVAAMTFQPRLENSGDEKKGASTLHFTATLPNAILDLFEPQLRAAFYRKELKSDDMIDLADKGAMPDDGLVRLKFRRIGAAIEWDEEFPSYVLAIDYGIADEPPIQLAEVKADAFRFDMRDGGSVLMKWRISAHPNEAQAGKLYTLNGREVTLNLTPPKDGAKGQKDLPT